LKPTPLVSRPRAFDKNDPRYIELRTSAVRAIHIKADGDVPERFLIEGTASSSTEDRYGDTLTEVCQANMLAQADGLTMWLNHSYEVPEDIAGTCINPSLERATAEDGTSCLDLKITLEIDPTSPRAMKSWQSVNRGTKLAFSIGGYFEEYEIEYDGPDDWWGHLLVDSIELLEISLVGIPANRRAYTKTFDTLRAAVVKRAEEIAVEARDQSTMQKRILVRKSFGLSAGEEHPEMKCTHADGCENEKVEGTEFCTEHTAAAPPATESPKVPVAQSGAVMLGVFPFDINDVFAKGSSEAVLVLEQLQAGAIIRLTTTKDSKGADVVVLESVAPAIVRTVEDPGAQGQIVECMKCIKNAIEAPGHAMCSAPLGHASAAHAILKAMLPDDYGLPEDAQISAPPPTVAAAPEIQALTVERDELRVKLTATETALADLKATATGRLTRSTAPGASSEGSEPTVDPDLYLENRSVLARRGFAKMSGATDARQSAQVRT
jgi:Caudovirus prohead serine protease